MKSFRFIYSTLAVVAAMLLFTACPKDDPDTLTVSPKNFTFTADETEEKIALITTNVGSWSTHKSESWVQLRESENNLYITVQNYTNTQKSREAIITITAGDAEPQTISIEQSKKEINSFSIDPTSLSFEANETGEKDVRITTDASGWKATTDAAWITLTEQANILKVKVVSKNTNTTTRTGSIKITAGNAPDITLTVTQGAATTLSINPTSLLYEASEIGEKSVTVSTNASSWNVDESASWITTTKSGNTLKVNVTSANTGSTSRSADIKITAGSDAEVILKVTQDPATTLSVDPTLLSYEASETGEKSVTISTNASSWDVTTSASWLTLSKSNNILKVRVTSTNTGSTSRSADIKITAGNAPEVILTVTQDAATTLSVNPTSLSYGATETGTKSVTISTNAASWSATKSASWIAISQNNNILRVNVTSSNTATSQRSANVLIEAGGASFTLPVTQTGSSSPGMSSYSASGTPVLFSGSASSWTGTITSYTTGSKYYAISNFGNDGITVRCNEYNNNITMDITTKVAENSTLNGYFRVAIIEGTTLVVISDYVHSVSYSASTRVMNFSGTFEGYQLLVGVAGYKKSNGEIDGVFTDFYRNLRLTLSSSTYAAPLETTGSSVAIRSSEIKNYTVKEVSFSEFKEIYSKSKNTK